LKIATVILAAGDGTRLGNLPKSLIRVNGQTILEQQVDVLRELNINDVVLVTGRYDANYKQLKLPSFVKVMNNPQANLGQGTSVRFGLQQIFAQKMWTP
jgi:molybdenum cofactor cytidylyltransferase/nicotine blue oxidoreductase